MGTAFQPPFCQALCAAMMVGGDSPVAALMVFSVLPARRSFTAWIRRLFNCSMGRRWPRDTVAPLNIQLLIGEWVGPCTLAVRKKRRIGRLDQSRRKGEIHEPSHVCVTRAGDRYQPRRW